MKKLLFIVAALAAAGCGKKEPPPKPVDYVKLCEHLVPLFPEDGRAEFQQTCEATYRRDLPECRNPSMVSDCFMGIKSWDERQACAALCIRNSDPR